MNTMESREWLARCSARLHAQWPRLPQHARDEAAADLLADPRWQGLTPEDAAAAWLALGMPNDVQRQQAQ
jgi:hypothetical protein